MSGALTHIAQDTPYGRWMEQEGIPIIQGYGVEDLTSVPREPWARVGGGGAFVHLEGMGGVTGMYVVEIPAGGSLEPEKHMYEEVMYVLRGRGLTQVWRNDQEKRYFEWGTGSLFAPPLNTWHRLINGSHEPALLCAVTNAPIVMDVYHSTDFIFGSDYVFNDRYQGGDDFFREGAKRYPSGLMPIWETNFIPDTQKAYLDLQECKGEGNRATQFEISGNGLVGHIHEVPLGKYQKCHYHFGGAVLMALSSQGYTLMWPFEAGVRPFEAGRGDSVVRVNWKPGSVFSPPHYWFHGHYNSGGEPARQMAIRYGSRLYDTGLNRAFNRQTDGLLMSVRDGGTMIEYEDEDPALRRMYRAELERNGMSFLMDSVL